jgi:D-serine deaminase-like pyridoxal phosphate-dependent protein
LIPALNIKWAQSAALGEVPSPALLLGLEPIEHNLGQMLAIAGGPERLRPHVKTHKLPQLVKLQLARGIVRYKCATIAEAEMCARAGAPDVLIAYPLVGPNVGRLLALQEMFPATKFSTVADDVEAIGALSKAATQKGKQIEVLLDIDVGQHRTGIKPGPGAIATYQAIAKSPALIPGGLHAYDGHLSRTDAAACAEAFAPFFALRDELLRLHLPVPRVVAGGTPTFPIHAARQDVECSPGTVLLWDASSATVLPNMDFQPAAVLLTRVVGHPGPDRLCLDLGHKAVASEMPHPRVLFPELPDAEAVTHSEEHLVLKTSRASEFSVGDQLLGVPWHICPSLALHAEAIVIDQGKIVGAWPIEARARRISI